MVVGKVQLPAWMVAIVIWIITSLILMFMADDDGSNNNNNNSLLVVSDDDSVVVVPSMLFSNHPPEIQHKYHQLQNMKERLQVLLLKSQERNQMFHQYQKEQTRALILIQQLQEQKYELLVNNNISDDTTTTESLEPHHSIPEVVSVHYDSERDNDVRSLVTLLKQSYHLPVVESSGDLNMTTTIRTIMVSKILPALHQWMMEKDWMAIQFIWDEMNTLHETTTTNHHTTTTTTLSSDGQCTAPTFTQEASSSQSDFATHEQLQIHFKNIKENILLSQQSTSSSMTPKLPLSFSSSVRILQQLVQSTWNDTIQSIVDKEILNDNIDENTQQQIVDDSSSDSNSDANCLPSIDWIYEWLNVGFDTMYRNNSLDLRRELLQAIYQKQHHLRYSNPDTNFDVTNVLLDIPSFVTTYQTQAAHIRATLASKPRYENLRQLLDRPSIYELSIYIDIVLDFISGRNDMLDDLMDRYIYNNPQFIGVLSSDLDTSHSPSTTATTTTVQVGPIIIAHIMNGLGHIPVPSKHSITNMISYVQSKLYPLRKKNQ